MGLAKLSISAGAEAPPSKMDSVVQKESVHCGRRSSRGMGEWRSSWDICAGGAWARCFTYSSCHPMPWSVRADTFKHRITALPLCFLFSSKAVSCFTGWDTETTDYGSAQGGKRKGDEEIQERISTCLEIFVQPKHECQHYLLCQPNTEIQK